MPKPASGTVPALLAEIANRYPDGDAVVGCGLRYTYRSLQERVSRVARGFYAIGVRPGDRVAILMSNHPDWIIADLAICSLGCVMVALNTWVTTRELKYLLSHSDTDTLILEDRFMKYDYFAMLDQLQPHSESIPALKRIIHTGLCPYRGSTAFEDLDRLGDAIASEAVAAAARAVQPEDIACLLYTSGSTSTPKGVQLQHFPLIENMWDIGERMHVDHRDRLWLAVSLFWGFGCENALFNMLVHGGCLVLQQSFDAGEALRVIEKERCTVFYGTPNMALAMADHPDRAQRDLSSLRTGGMPGTPEQLRLAIELGVTEISHIYGLTEVYGNCCVTDARLDPPVKRFTSVGRPLPGMDMRVAGPDRERVPVGEVGEIQVRGFVTPGYYKDEERTAAAFTADGYFRTGDLGCMDAEGFVYYRGRIKEMIKTGGISVAPAEIEEVLMAHDAVRLAFVVGIPDEEREEVIGAVIVPRVNAVEPAVLVEACRRELASFKVPRLFRFVAEESLPLTTTGKVQKNRLVELFAEPLT